MDRRLPDSAIDLMDEAAARVRMRYLFEHGAAPTSSAASALPTSPQPGHAMAANTLLRNMPASTGAGLFSDKG